MKYRPVTFALLALMTSMSLSGCGIARKVEANVAGYTQLCVAGVSYLQFPHGVTAQYWQDGSLATCDATGKLEVQQPVQQMP